MRYLHSVAGRHYWRLLCTRDCLLLGMALPSQCTRFGMQMAASGMLDHVDPLEVTFHIAELV
jgi:hypothetical protein